MSPRVREALSEFAYAFGFAFVPSFIGFLNGLIVDGKVVFPDLKVAGAALAAIVLSAIVAAVKSLGWAVTGTNSAPR